MLYWKLAQRKKKNYWKPFDVHERERFMSLKGMKATSALSWSFTIFFEKRISYFWEWNVEKEINHFVVEWKRNVWEVERLKNWNLFGKLLKKTESNCWSKLIFKASTRFVFFFRIMKVCKVFNLKCLYFITQVANSKAQVLSNFISF